MNHVERFKALMKFKPVDRLPYFEWAMWRDKTIDRWKSEGLPKQLNTVPEISHRLNWTHMYNSGSALRVTAYSYPGRSCYWYADDSTTDTGIMQNLSQSDALYWTAVECLLLRLFENEPWRSALVKTRSVQRINLHVFIMRN